MKINHNMSAVITNSHLLHSENGLAQSMERLSSGLKINHAKDDPAGMAISDKMKAQIDGLAQASQNASNGISVLQIADTATGEITNILQRMRELSVQAANDTNMLEDREAMQEEIEELKKEVDRIARDTEYNTKKLLDGSSDTRVYAYSDPASPIDVTRMAVTEAVDAGNYKMTIGAPATQATEVTTTATGPVPKGTVTVNGYEIEFTGEETNEEFYQKLRDGAAKGNVNVFNTDGAAQDLVQYPETGGYTFKTEPVTDAGGNPVTDADGNPVVKPSVYQYGDQLAFICNKFGIQSEVEIKCDSPEMEAFLGVPGAATAGTNIEITADLTSSFGAQTTVATDGNRIKVTDVAGFSMEFMVGAGQTGDIDIEVTDIGKMTLQIGANEHQTMKFTIPKISCDNLYLDEVDVTMVEGGGKSISVLDDAIAIVSGIRSRIGAYQNRLEYAVESLDAAEEDVTTAYSRIKDTDMAKEMTEYTKYTVLTQAGTSVLAQANDIPQTVLQLLQ
ncbi:MAG: flagellin [Roseburia sp.]|nr:flagellin [Roseburia sp.]